jgi:hypothetical protein
MQGSTKMSKNIFKIMLDNTIWCDMIAI